MIGIIDYGLGNIRAFSNVYKRLNIAHCIIASASDFG
ncbi:MAG: imidazole glycerol phosphate synthase subunit HisH, partial [Bacteroidia bacterium]|nr:imidazole glycerol phosphate synthase subunit HisH [Bacteroidia bacterium]